MPVTVGSFVTGGFGGSVPDSIVVPHHLGEVPKALILWTTGRRDTSAPTDGTQDTIFACYGLVDQARNGIALAGAANHNNLSNTGFRKRRIANNAIVLFNYPGGSTVSDPFMVADVSAWDADEFTLAFTADSSNQYLFHFLALSGDGVESKAIDWAQPGATGNHSITGVGFEPEVLINLSAQNLSSLPSGATHWHVNIGAATAENEFVALTRTEHIIQTTHRTMGDTATLGAFGNSAQTIAQLASLVSMDADGFTLNFSDTVSASRLLTLAIRGVEAKAGTFFKSSESAPTTDVIDTLPFAPEAVLLLSPFHGDEDGLGTINSFARLSLGALDADRQGYEAFYIDHDGGSSHEAYLRASRTHVIARLDGSTLAVEGSGSLRSDGFEIEWNPNTAVAQMVGYLAFAIEPAAPPTDGTADMAVEEASEVETAAWTDGTVDVAVEEATGLQIVQDGTIDMAVEEYSGDQYTGQFSGTAQRDGQPVEGALVWAMRETDSALYGPATSAADGSFTLRADVGATYHLFARYEEGEDGYNALSLWGVEPIPD